MKEKNTSMVTLFLCGDLMTGRGIDQVLPRSCPPRIVDEDRHWLLDTLNRESIGIIISDFGERPDGTLTLHPLADETAHRVGTE